MCAIAAVRIMDGGKTNDIEHAMPDGSATGPVQTALNRLDGLTDRTALTLGDLLDGFGEAAFHPVLIALALIVVSPLSGIPLLSTVIGLMIATVSAQLLFGRRRIWLPQALRRRSISAERLHRTMPRMRRFADWLDRKARRRLRVLVTPPFDTVPKAACFACGFAMPVLELVPFSSSLLGTAVVFLATALLTRDGLFAAAAFAIMAMAVSIPTVIYGGLIRGFLGAG